MMVTTIDTTALERISRLPADEAALEAATWLEEVISDETFLKYQVLPLFDSTIEREEVMTAVLADGGGAYSLLAFRWPSGATTQIHDHGSWAVVGVAAGHLREERYKRTDAASGQGDGQVRLDWSYDLDSDRISILMPYEGGIHRILNRSSEPAISIHLYGPNSNEGTRDYDAPSDEIELGW